MVECLLCKDSEFKPQNHQKKMQKKKKTQEERKGLENVNEAGRWWLTPIILATWKAEIRRIAV
jgi:hypothetical protein